MALPVDAPELETLHVLVDRFSAGGAGE